MNSQTVESRIIQILDLIVVSDDLAENLDREKCLEYSEWYDAKSRFMTAWHIWADFKDLELTLVESKGGYEELEGDWHAIWSVQIDNEIVYFKKSAQYYSHIGLDNIGKAKQVFATEVTKLEFH